MAVLPIHQVAQILEPLVGGVDGVVDNFEAGRRHSDILSCFSVRQVDRHQSFVSFVQMASAAPA
jgi:hypothetical protein